MNIRALNALRKIAAAPDPKNQKIGGIGIPYEYLADRDTAWVDAPGYGPQPTMLTLGGNVKTIEDLRRLQSRLIPRDAFKLAPGSPEYTELRKYLYNRGRVNYHNWKNPENPLPVPMAPQIKNREGNPIDPKRIEDWGNTMANRNGGVGNNRIG